MKKTLAFIMIIVAISLLCSCSDFFNPIAPGTGDPVGCSHKVVTDAAVEPSCKEAGLTEGSHCALCNEVIVKQESVAALPHTEVIDAAVAKTCTTDGLSAGTHCSVCNTKIIEQKIIPASHDYGEWSRVSDPDCFFEGVDTRSCTKCEAVDTASVKTVAHSFVQDEETKLFSCEKCYALIYAGNIYAAFDEQLNWYNAKEICESIGGHLATVTSEHEFNAIVNLIQDGEYAEYLLGGIKTNAGWKWITGEETSYFNWDAGQPENGKTQWYLGVRKATGKMHDYDHNHKSSTMGFVCEWEYEVTEKEHFFTEWQTITAPTCFGEGEEWRICTHCGLEETKALAQIEHSFSFKEESGMTSCEHCGAVTYNGRIYKIFTTKMSWFDAYAYCESLGGHLVTITSAEEQTFVETYMNSISFSTDVWTGGFNDGANWYWVTGEEFDYTNWEVQRPDCSQGHEWYIQLNGRYFGQWNDLPPLSSIAVFCEWEAN